MAYPVRIVSLAYQHNLIPSRYIYIPLGGSNNVIISTLLSFTFVALWHDLKLRLLAWGWLISLFILPELVLTKVFSEKKVRTQVIFIHLLMNSSTETSGTTGICAP